MKESPGTYVTQEDVKNAVFFLKKFINKSKY